MWYGIENDAQQEQSPYPRDLPPVIQQILAMPGPGDRGEGQGADFANMDVGFGGIMVPDPVGGGYVREVEMDPDGMMVDDHQGAAGAWDAPFVAPELQDLVEPGPSEGNPIWASYCFNWFQRYHHPEYSKYSEASFVEYLNKEYPQNER